MANRRIHEYAIKPVRTVRPGLVMLYGRVAVSHRASIWTSRSGARQGRPGADHIVRHRVPEPSTMAGNCIFFGSRRACAASLATDARRSEEIARLRSRQLAACHRGPMNRRLFPNK